MAQYFTPFPVKDYKAPGSKIFTKATDISKRFVLTDFIFNNDIIFDEYYVTDGERPDTIAYDYYDSANLDWIILLTNEIKDPYFQWVLTNEQFDAYLRQKYGSVEYALSTTHHYEKIVQQRTEYSSNYEKIIVPERTVIIDYTTYLTLPANDRKDVKIYDYEFLRNEQNRRIYLLDIREVETLREAHKTIFDTGTFTR